MSAHRFDARAFRLQSVEIDLRELLLRLLACAALVAAVTVAIALLETQVPVLGLSVLYLFAVLPVAILWGLGLAILVSVASMLSFNFFFLEPRHTLTLQDSSNWFALGVFLITSVVVSDLAARSRRRAIESTLLAEIAGLLLEHGEVSGELERIAAESARALRVEHVRIVPGEDARVAAGADSHALLAGGPPRRDDLPRRPARREAPRLEGGSCRRSPPCSVSPSTASAWPGRRSRRRRCAAATP